MQSRQIDLTINKMTKAQFNNITPNPDEVYLITDDNGLTQSDIITALGYTPANANSIGNATITVTQGGVSKGTFTTNQTSNATIALDAGGSGGIQNTATGTDSLTILGTPTTFDYAMNIGPYSNVTEDDSIAIGQGATVSGYDSLGIGRDCNVAGDNSIQLGYGTLTDDNIFQVWNYPLLDYPNGEIFEDRIPTTIARTSQIPSAVTENTVSGWGFTKNTGTVTSVNNVQPINGNVTISIPDVSNFVTNSSLATTLGDYVKSSLENTAQGTTASIGYVSGFAPVMQLTYGNYQMLCGCGEGAFLSMIDTTTNTQTAISAVPSGITIKQGQQQALLSLSNNNLLVNGSELATQTWVGQQGYITGINSSDVTTALGYTPVDVDMSNISTAGKIAITNIGYPTTTSKTLSLQSSGSSYTAPADGWVHITLALNIDGYVAVNSVYSQGGTAAGAYSSVFYPVSKGETFTVSYANRASTPRFRFYYAKGTESEAT